MLSKVRDISKRELTKSSLFYLSRRQGKHPKQFNHCLDQYFSQSKGDLGENLETAKVTFEMFKELDKRIIIVANFLGSLKIGCQDRRHRREGKAIVHTSSRRPIPVNMAFAGGNIYRVNDKLPQKNDCISLALPKQCPLSSHLL